MGCAFGAGGHKTESTCCTVINAYVFVFVEFVPFGARFGMHVVLLYAHYYAERTTFIRVTR